MDQGTHWRDMLNHPARSVPHHLGGDPAMLARASAERDDDDDLMLDMDVYQPWLLQRGRTRPATLLDLRWYDKRGSLWLGCAIAYPQLVAADYTSDKMLSLDFGKRQFILKGVGLDALLHRLCDYSVIAIQEYAPTIWPQRPSGPMIASIERVGAGAPTPPPR